MQSFTVVVASVLLFSQMVHSLTPVATTCLEENKVTKDDIFNWSDNGVLADGFKCFMKCMMLSSGSLSADGKIQVDVLTKKFAAEHHDMVKECSKIDQEGELCEVAYRYQKCLRDKNTENYKAVTKQLYAQ